MSSSNKHAFKIVDDMALPYSVNVNPVTRTASPYLIGGSNVLAQQSAPLTKRPGFIPHLPSFGATAVVKRIFTWRRWAASFYTMYSVIDTASNTSMVYDGGALIHTCAASQEPFDYVVSNNFLFFGNGVDMRKWDGTTVTNWGIQPQPVTAPTIVNAAAGNVPSIVGHTYVYAYGVSTTAYVSDISEQSLPTTVINRQWDVTGPRCSDMQCDEVHVYRTEDGGSVLYELSNSPIANPGAVTWTIRDNDFDVTQIGLPRLTSVQAPLKFVNLPPTPSMGLKRFAGRIWTFNDDTVYYSGLEEVTNGVPEESFGSVLTNSQAFGAEVTALEILGGSDVGVLLIFTPSTIFFISGSSLATFRIGTLSRRRGTRNRATVISGQMDRGGQTVEFVSWLDTTNTYRMLTFGGGVQDVSFDIAPDIASIRHDLASATIHEDGLYHWLVLCDGGADVLRVLDLERGKWNVPWPISGVTTAYSGETSVGTQTLMLGRDTKVLALLTGAFADEDVPYTAHAVMNLVSLLDPDRPEQVATLEYIGLERGSVDVSDVSYLLDEDPLTGSPTYTSILANIADPFLRATVDSLFIPAHLSGVNLIEDWYYLRDKSGARRVAVRLDWAAGPGTVGVDFKIFSVATVASRNGGS